MSLLLCHLLDTAAVAELMWSRYLAPRTRALLDDLGDGQGLRLLMWLCGVHDCGKATPAFQAMDPVSAERVRAAGLDWRAARFQKPVWRHGIAGGKVLADLLAGIWDRGNVEWVWPLVAGHHGSFPSKKEFGRQDEGEDHGRGPAWRQVQRAVVTMLTRALRYRDLGEVEPERAPNKAEQLMLSGLIVMADWIASAHEDFPGLDRLDDVCLATARDRARPAWDRLGVRGGWGQLPVPDSEFFEVRFGARARPFQSVMVELAREMPAPGLTIVEAPTGEGKTKGALAAAEVLAARFGADGVFVGMPTQATSDPMFSQVRVWADAFGPGVAGQVALLHGKRRFNTKWRELLADAGDAPDARFRSIALDDPYGVAAAGFGERRAPAEWFFGRNRGLLSGLVVGTIDQLL
ncbi:CRISPR-associated endonuclease Cas3'' [Amycolatopsis sp.]|uniref:CRISPR-associated endonuclease Cas3'' n=1 Tax=Amycolatopsis sp. TaxID=37632 RepID=UPI002CD88A8C|nr:CRISPR-associated endonuclease Cas3'' [Amycolatopsis sp.]HVV08331.1 CRISPR-associated endonuclease Cas3'' [Amycolatopsis sp.]